MEVTSPQRYEEQFTAFIDFLGFSEVSTKADETMRVQVLNLLLALATLRGEFDVESKPAETGGKSIVVKPAVSTFSDHVVVSYPWEATKVRLEADERVTSFIVMSHFNRLLQRIAAAALRIGFLIRGGATIGKLYHSQGVVFGEALVEAFNIESRTAVYPRVVLSNKLVERQPWIDQYADAVKCADGLYQFDYFKTLVLSASLPGENFDVNLRAWFRDAVLVVDRNLHELERSGRLNEFSKWAWFAREFRIGIDRLNPRLRDSFGISVDQIPWGRL